MMRFLAYADVPDQSNPAIAIIVISSGIVLVTAGFSLVPILFAWSRRHRHSDTIVALAILWGLGTAAVSIYAYIMQTSWAKERMLRIESGYFDPQDNSAAPALPWALWYVLAAILVGLIVWALTRGSARQVAAPKGAHTEGND